MLYYIQKQSTVVLMVDVGKTTHNPKQLTKQQFKYDKTTSSV